MALYTPMSNDALWRECASWLTKCEILREDQKVNLPEGGISDLANILRDGVLLCKLLDKIDPGCINMKAVNLKPAGAQFLCLRNIKLFLDVCKGHFELQESDLFEDTMLFECTHFHKVLCSLSALSRSEKAVRAGIPGFSAQVESNTEAEEEDIYQRVRATTNRSTCASTLMDTIVDYYSGEMEEAYDDLLAVRGTLKKATKSKRDYVINEILETEKNYVVVLGKIHTSFMLPLKNHMKPNDHACIFHKIQELYDVHYPFMKELGKIRTSSKAKLSEIFMKFVGQFLIYGSYGANLTKATALLQELYKDKIFNETVIRYERRVDSGKMKLKDVIVVPMQRVLKYHLLLDSLVKESDKADPEYECLCHAKEAMIDVAECINEEVRDVQHLDVINNLQDTIVEWKHDPDMRLSNYGKLIKDAEVKIKGRTEPKAKNKYIFIFDKRLLICEPVKGNQFTFCEDLDISEYRIIQMTESSFLLVRNNVMAYTIVVKTTNLQNEITDAINEALDKIQPREFSQTTHNLELHTFNTPVRCWHCNKYLKGLIYQGYICKNCNISVHKTCIEYSETCNICDNDLLEDKLWYAGEMNRLSSERKLVNRESGTFLVRIGTDSHAISLKIGDIAQHMRISTSKIDDIKKYGLSRSEKSRFFNTIEELVLYYENHSLQENFKKLNRDTKLLYPYRQIRAIALKDSEVRDGLVELTIKKGQEIIVIGKDGYLKGYWKGKLEDGAVGYFPAFVIRVLGDVRFD